MCKCTVQFCVVTDRPAEPTGVQSPDFLRVLDHRPALRHMTRLYSRQSTPPLLPAPRRPHRPNTPGPFLLRPRELKACARRYPQYRSARHPPFMEPTTRHKRLREHQSPSGRRSSPPCPLSLDDTPEPRHFAPPALNPPCHAARITHHTRRTSVVAHVSILYHPSRPSVPRKTRPPHRPIARTSPPWRLCKP